MPKSPDTNDELAELRRRLDSIDPARSAEREAAARAKAIDDRRAHITGLIARYKAAENKLSSVQAEHDRLTDAARLGCDQLERQLTKRDPYGGDGASWRAGNKAVLDRMSALWLKAAELDKPLRLARAEVAALHDEASQYGNPFDVLNVRLTELVAEHGRVKQWMIDELPRTPIMRFPEAPAVTAEDFGLQPGTVLRIGATNYIDR